MVVLGGSAAWAQPWRCLWRGSVLQMTMTRPCRRMIRQLLQIRLTLGLTFTVCLTLAAHPYMGATVPTVSWEPTPIYL